MIAVSSGVVALAGLVAVIFAMVGLTVVWVRSEYGWLPGAGVRDALGEVAVRLYPRKVLPRDRLRGRLWRLVRSQVSIDAAGRGLVPSVVRIRLSPDDLAPLEGAVGWITEDLAERLVQLADRNEWRLLARPVVLITPDAQRPTGRPVASAEFAAATVAEHRDMGERTLRNTDTVTLDGMGETPTFALRGKGPFVIGRETGCEVRVTDERVSRRHARLEYAGGQFLIVDMESTNGVKVNGVRVRRRLLASDDTIELSGRTSFRVVLPTTEAAASTKDIE